MVMYHSIQIKIAEVLIDDGIGITALALGILLSGKISGKQVSG